jgi:TonB family protein
MSEQTPSLKLDEKLRAEDQMFSAMLYRQEDRKIMWIAFGLAVLVHLIAIVIHFPKFEFKPQEKAKRTIVVRKYVPPPPQVEKRQVIQQQITRKVPLPDPTPDEPEPIREPEPEIEPEPLPVDAEILLGVPEPPPPSGPLIPGIGDVTNPVRIEESYVEPEYPELARQARLEGHVILQAVILRDGSVSEIQVLRVDRPNLGFEDAAIEAVGQWRYTPATQNGRPVDVYLTINVTFSLH